MSFNAPHDPPQGQPECGGGCHQRLTRWVWDEEYEEWHTAYCEACQKRVLAKAEAVFAGLSSSGKLTEVQSQRFVDYVVHDSMATAWRPRWWNLMGWYRYLAFRRRVRARVRVQKFKLDR